MWLMVDCAYHSARPLPCQRLCLGRWNLFMKAVKPRGRRVTRVEGASGRRLSKHNHFPYFERAQGLKDGLPVPDCQSRCHCISSALLWLLTARYFGENQQRRTLHHLGRQVSSQITFFFLPPFRSVSRGSSPACDLRLRHSASSLLSSNAAWLRHERDSPPPNPSLTSPSPPLFKRALKCRLGCAFPACPLYHSFNQCRLIVLVCQIR